MENVNVVSKYMVNQEIEWMEVALPIGISFFTFQKISYTIDVYRKKNAAQAKFSNYLLFVALFPQLIAGPIIRYGDIASQLTKRDENIDNCINGMFRFIIGLAKKVLIANVMAAQVLLIQSAGIGNISSIGAWTAALAFTFQIYFDFSGYSDMAIGLGKMMGFKFPENFNFPYRSRSITEFWQRWHITLSGWMKDYLYIPLGGNKLGSVRTFTNLFIVFLISGFWHGAAWNFIIWGAFHGFFLIIERAFFKKWLDHIPKIISVFYCFLMVLIGWVFFSTDTLDHSLTLLHKMFSFNASGFPVEFENKFIFFFGVAILFSFFPFGKLFIDKVTRFQDNFSKQKPTVIVGATLVLSLLLILSAAEISAGGFNPFLYYKF